MEFSSSDETADAIFLAVIQVDVSQSTVCCVGTLANERTLQSLSDVIF